MHSALSSKRRELQVAFSTFAVNGWSRPAGKCSAQLAGSTGEAFAAEAENELTAARENGISRGRVIAFSASQQFYMLLGFDLANSSRQHVVKMFLALVRSPLVERPRTR